MTDFHNYSITAVRDDGESTELKVRTPTNDAFALGTTVTTENGRHLIVIDRGLYRAVGSGAYYRSEDPHAP
jgi:hypothetical protein